jgi:hypothetical protein
MSGATVLADFCSVSEQYVKQSFGNSEEQQGWVDYYLNCEGTLFVCLFFFSFFMFVCFFVCLFVILFLGKANK